MQIAASSNVEEKDDSAPLSVLIAEDSPVSQDILKLLLSSKGHDVEIARDGKEALKLLKERRFDVALMDFYMPVMNGGEVVTKLIAEAPDKPRPMFVAMTAEPEALAGHTEFAKIFAKPFDFDDVLDFIEGAMLADERGTAPVPPPDGVTQLLYNADADSAGSSAPDATSSQTAPDAQKAAQAAVPEHADDGTIRVLIAEDSPVTQDILKLLLTSKGYDVQIAHDGTEALQCLKEQRYNLALMDYHMPGLTGAEVVAQFAEEAGDLPRPVFVAMTADTEAVAGNTEFARVFSKPFDFDVVIDFIEGFVKPDTNLPLLPAGTGMPQSTPPSNSQSDGPAAAAFVPPTKTAVVEGEPRILNWPGDIGPAGFSVAARQYMAAGNDYDAVVISEPATPKDLSHLWTFGDLNLLPIIDETGHLGSKADINLPSIPRGVVNRLIETTLQEFAEARASVHIEVRQTKILAEKLIAGIYARKRKLFPQYNGAQQLGVSYNTSLDDEEILNAVGELLELGLIKRKFFDRMHTCRGCRSVRLNAREECFECHSANLVETTMIHHFKCAYQGPQEDFQQGSDLVCPKCARELRHFGVDYDKPGTIINCQSCSNSSSEAVVGFQCLDCGEHTDGEMIATRDVYEYSMTEKGVAFVEEGHIVIGGAQTQLKFAELPLDLVIALNKSARDFNEEDRPFCLLNIGYPEKRALVSEHGSRMIEKSRAQLVENIGNYFGDGAMTHQGVDYDYVLLNRLAAENCRANLDTYSEIALSGLKINLQPRLSVFGPKELFG